MLPPKKLTTRTKVPYLLLLLLLFSSSACAKSKRAFEMANKRQVTVSTRPSSQAVLSPKKARRSPATPQRKLIQRAELSLSMKKYEPFAKALSSRLQALKGHMADVRVTHSTRQVSRVEAVIRVPSKRFTGFLQWVRKQGHVTFERMSGEDVTAQYYDMKARKRNLQRLESRLLDLLKAKTAKLKDIIQVERELARVRSKIERMEGRLRMWDRLVAMGTLRLKISIEQHYTPSVAKTFGQKLSQSTSSSFREFTQFLQDLLIGSIAALPWLLFFALAFFFLRAIWRFWRRPKPAKG